MMLYNKIFDDKISLLQELEEATCIIAHWMEVFSLVNEDQVHLLPGLVDVTRVSEEFLNQMFKETD